MIMVNFAVLSKMPNLAPLLDFAEKKVKIRILHLQSSNRSKIWPFLKTLPDYGWKMKANKPPYHAEIGHKFGLLGRLCF